MESCLLAEVVGGQEERAAATGARRPFLSLAFARPRQSFVVAAQDSPAGHPNDCCAAGSPSLLLHSSYDASLSVGEASHGSNGTSRLSSGSGLTVTMPARHLLPPLDDTGPLSAPPPPFSSLSAAAPAAAVASIAAQKEKEELLTRSTEHLQREAGDVAASMPCSMILHASRFTVIHCEGFRRGKQAHAPGQQVKIRERFAVRAAAEGADEAVVSARAQRLHLRTAIQISESIRRHHLPQASGLREEAVVFLLSPHRALSAEYPERFPRLRRPVREDNDSPPWRGFIGLRGAAFRCAGPRRPPNVLFEPCDVPATSARQSVMACEDFRAELHRWRRASERAPTGAPLDGRLPEHACVGPLPRCRALRLVGAAGRFHRAESAAACRWDGWVGEGGG